MGCVGVGNVWGSWTVNCKLSKRQTMQFFIVPLSVLVYPFLVLCHYCPVIVIPTPMFPHRCFCLFPPYAHPRRCSRPVVVFFVQVDVVIQGHEHAYARTCMLFRGSCVDRDVGLGAGSGVGEDRIVGNGGGMGWVQGVQNEERSGLSRVQESSLGERHERTTLSGTRGAEAAAHWRAESAGTDEEGHSAREGRRPSRAPVYVLAGNAGAGFTHGFPNPLPEWVTAAFQVSWHKLVLFFHFLSDFFVSVVSVGYMCTPSILDAYFLSCL